MMSPTGWAITLLVVLWALAYAAVASATVMGSSASPCFHLHSGLYSDASGCGRIGTLALANASDNGIEGSEEESEEAELEEEAASATARAEEADTRVASPPATPNSGAPAKLRSAANVVVVSRLRLTAKAASALTHHDPLASTVAFSFRLNTAAKVRVTLLMRRKSQGRRHWETLPDALTLSADKGTVSRTLTGHNRLSPGRYRLTVKPIAGTSRSIYLSAHD
jgi:hypothetical protein